MNTYNSLEKLEYNKIIDMLLNYCKTYIGKDLATNLLPTYKQDKVQKLLNETFEATNLLDRKGSLPISEIENITT